MEVDNAKRHSFKCIAKVFRIVELCFLLILLIWICTHLPFAVKISGEYCRQIAGVVLSPLFIFVLCNFIVVTLLFKSRRLSGETELYGSFLENTEFSISVSSGKCSFVDSEIVYEDKQMIFEETETVSSNNAFESNVPRTQPAKEIFVTLHRSEMEKCHEVAKSGGISPEKVYSKVVNEFNNEDFGGSAAKESKVPRRTKSEKLRNESTEEICLKLRRSETDNCLKATNPGESSPETASEVDELSNEDFQKAIEEFIDKQIKFHRQEKLAIVLHSQAAQA